MNANIISFCHTLSKKRQTKNPFSHSVSFTPNSPSCPLCSLHIPLRNNKPPQPIPDATMPMGPHLFSQNLFASPQTSSYSLYLWCTGITAVKPQPLPIRLLPKRLMNLYFSWNETVRPGKDTLSIHLSIQIVTKGLQGSDAPLRIWEVWNGQNQKKRTALVKSLIGKHRQ